LSRAASQAREAEAKEEVEVKVEAETGEVEAEVEVKVEEENLVILSFLISSVVRRLSFSAGPLSPVFGHLTHLYLDLGLDLAVLPSAVDKASV